MKILVTGAAGFIGYHLCEVLLKNGFELLGLDNINDYYSVDLKFDRLKQLGISRKNAEIFNEVCTGALHNNQFSFVRMKLEDRKSLPLLFEKENIDVVCNLAAQAGVRNSLENPEAYIDSNIGGFLNLLECCRKYKIKHLVYASSSSVYGLNKKIPFSTKDNVDHPISLYAASKKSNELMAHTYSHLFSIPTTGLRFFTVYGPWGRPDMAIYIFTHAIMNDRPIKVFNHGKMERDFTYVGDIVESVARVVAKSPKNRKNLYEIYNVGNNNAIKLSAFIEAIEHHVGKKAEKELLPLQPGDLERTWASVDDFIADYDYQPDTSVNDGVREFVEWYKNYYRKK